MNTPSPLVPQGTSPDRGKTGLYFKVIMIVMVHVVVIGGLLLQGCKETKPASPDTTSAPTNDYTNTEISSLPPVNTNNPPPLVPGPGPSTSTYSALPPAAPGTNPIGAAPYSAPPVPPPTITPTAPLGEGKEYVIARGDTLAKIAKKEGVSLKALQDANPGLDARKLKVGAKLQVPAGATGGTTGSASTLGASSDMGDMTVYTVKAGDMLGRIAKSHGTTVAKLKELNDLKSTSIKVGQKLKLPAGGAAAPATTPSTAATPSASTMPGAQPTLVTK